MTVVTGTPLSAVDSAVIKNTLLTIEHERRSIGGRKAAATRRYNTAVREGIAKIVTEKPTSDKLAGKRQQRERRTAADRRNGWRQ